MGREYIKKENERDMLSMLLEMQTYNKLHPGEHIIAVLPSLLLTANTILFWESKFRKLQLTIWFAIEVEHWLSFYSYNRHAKETVTQLEVSPMIWTVTQAKYLKMQINRQAHWICTIANRRNLKELFEHS